MLTGAERMSRALQIQEPDRIPFFEAPNSKIRQRVFPGAWGDEVIEHVDIDVSSDDVIEYFDLDAIRVDDRFLPGYLTETLDSSHSRNQWGTIVRRTKEALVYPVEGAIKSEKDLDTWQLPDPDEPWRYARLAELVRKYKGQRSIIASFADPFNVANEVRGGANHFMDFIRNPDLVDQLAELIGNYYLRYIKNCVEVGVDIIWVGGDYATAKAPMLAREHFAKHVIPVLKSLVDEAKSRGAYIIKHSDGNISPIIDMILDTGINGLNPIDPSAGMDLGEVKKKYGHRVCLMGNVDCGYILSWGTVEEVREDVRRCIKQAGRGGGYIAMSSNSIHSAVKPENYIEMVKAIREYGKYPLAI